MLGKGGETLYRGFIPQSGPRQHSHGTAAQARPLLPSGLESHAPLSRGARPTNAPRIPRAHLFTPRVRMWAVGLLGGELRVDQVSEERGAVCSLVLLAELTVQNSRADPQSHTREDAGPTPKVILEKMA